MTAFFSLEAQQEVWDNPNNLLAVSYVPTPKRSAPSGTAAGATEFEAYLRQLRRTVLEAAEARGLHGAKHVAVSQGVNFFSSARAPGDAKRSLRKEGCGADSLGVRKHVVVDRNQPVRALGVARLLR